MKIYLAIILIVFTISFTKTEELPKTSSGETSDAVAKSSVTKKPAKDDGKKIDSETKEQLEESSNDDKDLEKQEKVKANDQSENVAEDDSQDSDEGSTEENVDDNDNEADSDDAPEEDQSTIKRGEASKGGKDKKKSKKYLAYPMFYPGDYFGGYGHNVGGPLGFHPGSVWEYPYPYVHPMYPSPFYPCQCKCKDDKEKEEDKKEKDKKTRRKQLVPSHYYGPPSAGWGAYQPGHTGGGWGAPYWYKSYIPVTNQAPKQPITEGAQARHIIEDGLDFGFANSHDSAQISYGHGEEGVGLGETFGADWHDGYTDHPVYGTYGAASGRTTYVDPVYGDLENAGLNGWGHGVGRPYLSHGEEGNEGHGYAEAIGHPYLPSQEGLNHGPVHHGETFFGPHTAMLPTAQGHVQVASAGHAVGMGGHNLGGFADKFNPVHGSQGDFVGGIHADLGSHEITGHHHDHAAAGHTNAPLLHKGSTGYLHGDLGDHFGSVPEHHANHVDLGMQDHFGPILEHSGGHGGFAGGHGGHAGGHGGYAGGHDVLHGHHGGHHNMNHRIFHDFSAHAGHGGAFDGHIGDSISASHLFGGVHKSGVPIKHKGSKKYKPKAQQHKKKGKSH